MSKYNLILASFCLCLSVMSLTPYASASQQSAPQIQAAYEEHARALGGKIKIGFKETSYLPGVVDCAGQVLGKYAKTLSDAVTLTEMYLLMGKDTMPPLNLEDKDAVITFLKMKFKDRVTKNFEGAIGYIFNKTLGKCVAVPLDLYVGMRITQATDWAFSH